MQYRVKSGDSLWRIAKANPVPGQTITERIRAIAAASGITDPNKIKPGQVIIVPGGKEPPTPRARPDPVELSRRRQMDTRGAMPRPGGARPEREPRAMPAAPQRSLIERGRKHPMTVLEQFPEMVDRAPPVGNLSADSFGLDMATELMKPDFAQAGPGGAASQVAQLPPGMDTASFPADLPATEALAPSPTANVIGPQFNETSFGATPQGMADPALAAILDDPIKRQMMMQALLQPGGGM